MKKPVFLTVIFVTAIVAFAQDGARINNLKEGGADKVFEQVVQKQPFTCTIPIAVDSEMVSVSYEMPAK